MFRFKQFTIRQERCSMKVGTDGVLLGAWTQVQSADRRILDIGTGTGLIALQLAQRSQAQVTGIDIDDVSQARENTDASPWRNRVEMVQCAVQLFTAEPFDLIVSNPPYFVDSLTCPDVGRTMARHTTELTFVDLHDAVVRLLSPEGRFSLILPPAESALFSNSCSDLYLSRCTEVHTTPDSGCKRVLMEFMRQRQPTVVASRLVIGTGKHEEYTDAYRDLTCDFYLKF